MQTGIVLKIHFSKTRKISVLDSQLGRIECVPPHENIHAGSIIRYYCKKGTYRFFIKDVALLAMPLQQARQDLLFIHQILELLYYFIPEHSYIERVFEIVVHVYNYDVSKISDTGKKLFLCKVLTMLGFYPELEKTKRLYFQQLMGASIDELLQTTLNSEIDTMLKSWLTRCIALHPQGHLFNTYHLLNRSRVV